MPMIGGGAPSAYTAQKPGFWDYLLYGLGGAPPSRVDNYFANQNLQRQAALQQLQATQNWNAQFQQGDASAPQAQAAAPMASASLMPAAAPQQAPALPAGSSLFGDQSGLTQADPSTAATLFGPSPGVGSYAPGGAAPSGLGGLAGLLGGMGGGAGPQAPQARADDPTAAAPVAIAGAPTNPLPDAPRSTDGGRGADAAQVEAGGMGSAPSPLIYQTPNVPGASQATGGRRPTMILDAQGHFRPMADLAPVFAQAAQFVPGAKDQWAMLKDAADYDKPSYVVVPGVGLVDQRHGTVDRSVQSNEWRYDNNGVPYQAYSDKSPGYHPAIGTNQEYVYDARGNVIGTRAMLGATAAVGALEGAKAAGAALGAAPYTPDNRQNEDGSPDYGVVGDRFGMGGPGGGAPLTGGGNPSLGKPGQRLTPGYRPAAPQGPGQAQGGQAPGRLRGQSKFAASQADADGANEAKTFQTIQDQGAEALKALPSYSNLRTVMKGINTNALTPSGMALAGAARSVGLNLDPKLSQKEFAQSLMANMVNHTPRAPGAQSDSELKMRASQAAQMSQTPQGRDLIIQNAMTDARRDAMYADLAAKYRDKFGSLNALSGGQTFKSIAQGILARKLPYSFLPQR